MTTSPWTHNRYAFGAGNPISRIENNGHCWGFLSDACEAVGGAVSDAVEATTDWWNDTAQPWLEENVVDPVQEAAEAAAEAVGDAVEAVGDAAEATVDFVEEHKAEIAGIVAGIVVGGACLVATGGAGSVGCAALGGAVGAGIAGYMNGQRGWELVGSVAIGAAAGAIGGALGSLAFRGLGAVAGRLGSRLGGLVNRGTPVYRVVGPDEAADIAATGVYRSLPGMAEGKYFFLAREHAESLAAMYTKAGIGGPYTLTSGLAPRSVIAGAERVNAAGEGPAIFVREQLLSRITNVRLH